MRTLFLLFLVGLLILYIEIRLSKNAPVDGKKAHLPGKFMAVLTDLHAIGTSPSFYAAVLTSLAIPFCQVLGLWAVMRAYGLTLSFLAAVVVLLIINLGVSLPNAPANVGSYQFFCVLGLSIFDVEKTRATGFSIFAFLALTIPLAFLGFARAPAQRNVLPCHAGEGKGPPEPLPRVVPSWCRPSSTTHPRHILWISFGRP